MRAGHSIRRTSSRVLWCRSRAYPHGERGNEMRGFPHAPLPRPPRRRPARRPRPGPGQRRQRAITPDDYFSLAAVTELAVSPDGKHVAYSEARWDQPTDDRKADLWVVADRRQGQAASGSRPTGPTTATRGGPPTARPSTSSATASARPRRSPPTTAPPRSGASRSTAASRRPSPASRAASPGSTTPARPTHSSTPWTPPPPTRTTSPSSARTYKAGVRPRHAARCREVYRLDLDTWRAEKVIAEKQYVREFAVTARRQAGGDDRRPGRHGDQVRGQSRVDVWEAESKKVTPTDETLAEDGRRRRTRGWRRWPGRRTATGWRSAPSSTPTRPRSSSTSSRTASGSATRMKRPRGRPRPRLRHAAAVAGRRRRSATSASRPGGWRCTATGRRPTTPSACRGRTGSSRRSTSARRRRGRRHPGRRRRPSSRTSTSAARRRRQLTEPQPAGRRVEAADGQARHLEGGRRRRGRRRAGTAAGPQEGREAAAGRRHPRRADHVHQGRPELRPAQRPAVLRREGLRGAAARTTAARPATATSSSPT